MKPFVRRYFPNEDPVGRRVKGGGNWQEPAAIVGVVADVRQHRLDADLEPRFYRCYFQGGDRWMSLGVRAAGDPLTLAGMIRSLALSVDPSQPVEDVQTLEQRVSGSLAPQRTNSILAGVFDPLAVGPAAVGIYGLISYVVTQRTHEIGVRMALGAARSDVVWQVLTEGLRLVLIGIGLGVAGAFTLTRILTSALYGVKATDPLTFAAVSLLLLMVALMACGLPARRAAQVDPMVALSYE